MLKSIIGLIVILSLATMSVAQPDYMAPATVSDEARFATVAVFFFAAVVLTGTYTTHHWEGDIKRKATRTYLPMAGDGMWAFAWAKMVWFGVYIMLALAMWFTWFTAGQELIKWYWVWSLFGALLVLDKLWAYLYFYATRWAYFGLFLAGIVAILGWVIFGLLIAQFVQNGGTAPPESIVLAGSNPLNLVVAIVLMGVFSLIYLVVILYNAYMTLRDRPGYTTVQGQGQMQQRQNAHQQYYPQNYVQVTPPAFGYNKMN